MSTIGQVVRRRIDGVRPRYITLGTWMLPVVALVALLVIWELAVESFDVPPYILPPPSNVLGEFTDDPGYISDHTLQTGFAAFAGFSLAVLIGVPLAIAMAYSRPMEQVLYPYMIVIKVLPVVAIAPLMAIWFGFGPTPKIVIAFLIAFFPIVVNGVLGFRSTPRDYLMLMRGLNASGGNTFLRVRAPFALPFLFASFRVAAPTAVIGAIVAEFVGSGSGLGFVILLAKGYLQTDLLFLAVVASAVLGILMFGAVVLVERRVLYWHESHDG